MVFNLEVDGQHVYSVAGNGLLVHNDCGIASVALGGGHVGIDVDGVATHLTNPRGKGKALITKWVNKHKNPDCIDIDIPDVGNANAVQASVLGEAGEFCIGENSCVTHVIDVLRAGGVDVSGLPTSLDDGFWEALRALRR